MSQEQIPSKLPAPCIVDCGTIVNKDDMKRLLKDIGQVRYIHSIDRHIHNQGQGWIIEIFNDAYQSTLIANGNLYINLQSFDCLQLSQSPTKETYFDLIQDNRLLRLIPLGNVVVEQSNANNLNAAAIEAMVTEVLSAHLDAQFDDDDF
jgi:hypothetical protein